jgi:hypothetical protein
MRTRHERVNDKASRRNCGGDRYCDPVKKAKLVELSRDLDAARTDAVASGVVGTSSSPRVRQLLKKIA